VTIGKFIVREVLGLLPGAVAMSLAAVVAAQVESPSASARAASGMPLFDAFKTFCVDTGAKPSAVKAAVEAAGGKVRRQTDSAAQASGAMGPPFPLTLTTWDIAVQGHTMMVDTGTSYPSRRLSASNSQTFDFDTCSIHSIANEDASVAAVRDWVGVPPAWVSTSSHSNKRWPDLTQYHYVYQTVGTVHMGLADRDQGPSAQTEGRYWGLVLLRDARGASLQLIHDLPAVDPRPQP
jgi:hypothetical protein